MSLTLVTGPVRSGKSRHAEGLLADRSDVLYLATGPRTGGDHTDRGADTDQLDRDLDEGSGDAEWAARVRLHQARRPASWRTVETSAVEEAMAAAGGPVLLDCLGTWLTAVVDAVGWHDLDAARTAVRGRTDTLLAALATTTAEVVVVTNEVGWSLVPTTASGRFFQDELGRLNALVAVAADRVHLVVVGRVLDLSDAPVVGSDLRGPPGA
ncbi:MAG: adenosylcobinamide kinase [Humibacillus sp.]|nr:adenosylcobinamide kinase [Humibacillus sp.]